MNLMNTGAGAVEGGFVDRPRRVPLLGPSWRELWRLMRSRPLPSQREIDALIRRAYAEAAADEAAKG